MVGYCTRLWLASQSAGQGQLVFFPYLTQFTAEKALVAKNVLE
ncbi:MAG: hypothetical protein VB877_15255 [Pirellulaceae bacterium]